jgi:subtilisin family serine protease
LFAATLSATAAEKLADKQLHLESGVYTLTELAGSTNWPVTSAFRSMDFQGSRHFFVQSKSELSPAHIEQLEKSGVEIIRYIPDDAYLVRATSANLSTLRADFLIAPYRADVRVSSDLKLRNVFNQHQLVNLRMQLFPSADLVATVKRIEDLGFLVKAADGKVITVQTKLEKLDQLAGLEEVEWISKKSNMQLQFISSDRLLGRLVAASNQQQKMAGDYTDLTGYESGVKIMNFPRAWSAGFFGQGQTVAVADTGLDTGEKSTLSFDFKNFGEGYALGYASTTWADYIGHGTHVAGSVGGVGAQSEGSISGGALRAKLLSQSLWSQEAKNLTTPEDLRELFKHAYDKGARIHTNSWGDPDARGVYNMETSQVDDFVWNHPDMVILFAAGNDGVDIDGDGRIDSGAISAPATSKNIIAVGSSENYVHRGGIQSKLGELGSSPQDRPWATDPIASDTLSNNPKGLAAFSSRGPTRDGRLKPDVVAPGSNILSNCSHQRDAKALWGRYNKDYCFSGGTSMSTPLVAGAAALVRERLVQIKQLGRPSAALVKAVLLHTAEDLYPGQFGEVGAKAGQEILKRGPNPDQGYGRVDVGRATASQLSLVDGRRGVEMGESREYLPKRPINKITLVYTDAPASPMAAKSLVNDLDLEVHVGDQVYRSGSSVDNTEQVLLPQDVQGMATKIVVRGTRVVMGKNGKQPYALVY